MIVGMMMMMMMMISGLFQLVFHLHDRCLLLLAAEQVFFNQMEL
jgi:hypothetical protein